VISVICNKNKGYQWTYRENCWFKGYLQDPKGNVLRGEAAISQIKAAVSFEDLINILKAFTGVFSFIVKQTDEVWAAVDIARSMPLYYVDDYSVISDDIDQIMNSSQKPLVLSDIRIFEMYASSYISFDNTIYDDVKQIELGCVARFSPSGFEQRPYYVHGKKSKDITESEAFNSLSELSSEIVKRIKMVAGNRQIILSLSGGYDSRYLACSLKRAGVDNIVCYTYGRRDSFDVLQSKKVAEALQYEWHNVYYEGAALRSILENDCDYLNYANRPDYIVYLQNYLAVKFLTEKHLIPQESIFITGLCNDMPTGYYIPTEQVAKEYGFSLEGVAEYSIDNRFVRIPITSTMRSVFKSDILKYFDRMDITVEDYSSFVSALDCLETANAHSRCYLNMNEVHAFFGYEWMIPCWDPSLLDFWYTLPVDMRRGQYLYEKYLLNDLCIQYGLGEKKHINSSAATAWKRALKRKVGTVVVKIAYPLGIPIHRNTDINNFSYLEVELYRKIVQKNAIKADRAALILLLSIYMMEYRYGSDWYERIKQFTV